MITARNYIYRRNQVGTVMMLPDCPGNFCVKSFRISSIHSSCFDGLCRTWWHKNKEKTSSLHVICEKYGLLHWIKQMCQGVHIINTIKVHLEYPNLQHAKQMVHPLSLTDVKPHTSCGWNIVWWIWIKVNTWYLITHFLFCLLGSFGFTMGI